MTSIDETKAEAATERTDELHAERLAYTEHDALRDGLEVIGFLFDEIARRDAEIVRLREEISALTEAITDDPDIACQTCRYGRIVNGKEICDKNGCVSGIGWKLHVRYTQSGPSEAGEDENGQN